MASMTVFEVSLPKISAAGADKARLKDKNDPNGESRPKF